MVNYNRSENSPLRPCGIMDSSHPAVARGTGATTSPCNFIERGLRGLRAIITRPRYCEELGDVLLQVVSTLRCRGPAGLTYPTSSTASASVSRHPISVTSSLKAAAQAVTNWRYKNKEKKDTPRFPVKAVAKATALIRAGRRSTAQNAPVDFTPDCRAGIDNL